MKKMVKAAAILAAMVLAAGVTACQKKDGAAGGGEAQKSAGTAKAAKPTPVNEFSRELTSDGSGVIILKYNGSAKNVVIPSEIEGLPVQIIGVNAFKGKSTMKSVIIPDSVVAINGGAFYECSALESVTLGNSVRELRYYKRGSDEYGAFTDCTALKSITIPDSVQVIGESAFERCRALESVIIPDSVKKIGGSAFEGCSALKSVTLGNSVQEIGYRAFMSCKSLQSLTIPDSLQKIKFANFREFAYTELPLATQARLRALGYTDSF